MIGNSLKLILKKCGYNTFAIDYLGDWGTQFGKMIVAYKKWGNLDKIKADPINELTALYVKFHDDISTIPVFYSGKIRNQNYLQYTQSEPTNTMA